MVKTTPLTEDTHKILKTIQSMLRDGYNIDMTFTDIIAYIITDPKQSVEIILDKIIEKREMGQNITNMKIREENNI